MKVNILNGQVETFEITSVECILESLDGNSFKITAFTTNRRSYRLTLELQIGVHVLKNGHI